jgi:acyl dehydratase
MAGSFESADRELEEEFERHTAAKLLDDDIGRARQLLGIDAASDAREYVSRASEDSIRNFAIGLGDDNPLFVDPAYGRATRFGGQIAPSSMAAIINTPMRGDPLPAEAKRLAKGLFRGIHVFVSGGEWVWYRPIHPGDRLFSFSGEESLEVKPSEFGGRTVIRIRRVVKLNQRGEVVGVYRVRAILSERKTARDRGKYARIQPAHYTDEDIAAIDAVYAAERRRGAEPRWFEDVVPGESLGRMAKGPLTQTEIIAFHAGGYGWVPYRPSASRLGYQNRQRIPAFYVKNEQGVPDVAQRVHWDSKWAQAIGNPMAYDYGVMRDCWFHHFLTDWIGDDGWVHGQYTEMRQFNYVGDTQYVTGEVVGKRVEEGRCFVDVAMRMVNQRGVETAPGRASLILPSREHGPVLPWDPPLELRRRSAQLLQRHFQLAAGGQ